MQIAPRVSKGSSGLNDGLRRGQTGSAVKTSPLLVRLFLRVSEALADLDATSSDVR